jgi:hypothetical protein
MPDVDEPMEMQVRREGTVSVPPTVLTATQARALAPAVDIAQVLGKISKRIEAAARAGKLSVNAIDDMPKMSGWDAQRAANIRNRIHQSLRDLGYTVKPMPGGGHVAASESLLVDWGRAA